MSDENVFSDIDRRREAAGWKRAIDRVAREMGQPPFRGYESGEADIGAMLRRVAARDLAECPLSREQVAEGLSKLLGRDVSRAMVDAVVAETHPHRFAAEWIPAWVRVTGSIRLLELITAECGLWTADADQHELAEYGRSALQRDKLDDKLTALKRRLAERI